MKKRVLTLLLVLALALSIGACGKKADDEGGGDGDLAVNLAAQPSPTEDPAGFLRFNAHNTATRLAERYAGSPFEAMASSAARSGVLRFTLGTVEEYGMELGGELTYDVEAGKLRLDATLASGDALLDASAYIGTDFVAVSSQELLGDTLFYGVTPYDLYGQFSSGAFAGYMGEEAQEALRALDAALEELRGLELPDSDALAARYEELFDELIEAMDLTGEETTVELDGQSLDGYSISGELDSEDMAGLMEKYGGEALSDPTLVKLAALSGWEAELDRTHAEFDESLEDLRASGVRCRVTFISAGGLLTSVSVDLTDTDGTQIGITADLLRDDMISGQIATDGDITTYTSVVSTDNGYSHVLTVTAQDGSAITLSTLWGKDGILKADVVTPDETSGISAKLTADDAGFTLSDLSVTEAGSTTSLPLTLAYTPTATVETPAGTVNLTTLSEEELSSVTLRALMKLSALAG